MFEKSLYDLIRGLRNHKGNEREYIQQSLRECRLEIKGSDIDLKATALLKLIYLEMFGHDMSWASFHVLEVMSSQKYLQKRVGYLAAVQSFRPDTDVLMLATNLLKKDVSSSAPLTISLPLITLPHIITPSLALSLLSDLLPRLAHSNAYIKKKSIAALYRLALAYPDALKAAWPKIKDLLMDDDQDSSVTAAIVNVICELGWRRPRDFLSLAPRLFELLVEGGNNWMAIKIIKLFASLTPLEPRLIKKLLPPLTNLIRTTPAMSLLYECINGVIQGGILEGRDATGEGEEIAALCVSKLRGMILVDGDPNLKYVALLAFNQIVRSHPHLVSLQEDVIMNCIDDLDISIRLKALELGADMVNRDNLVPLVERLLRQLQAAPLDSPSEDDIGCHSFVEPAADSDGQDPEAILRPSADLGVQQQALPAGFRVSIVQKIISMCSKDTYVNVVSFEWYIETLLKLVKVSPASEVLIKGGAGKDDNSRYGTLEGHDVFSAIGFELQNIAVRVRIVRSEAVQAADMLLSSARNNRTMSPHAGSHSDSILAFAAWIVGEYAPDLANARSSLETLLHPQVVNFPPSVICAYVQAIPKVFAQTLVEADSAWDVERKTMIGLLLARVIELSEPLQNHPALEVQERAVEFSELMRLGSQAMSSSTDPTEQEPYLLTTVLPQLFSGSELNPVARTAQRKVALPADLDLDSAINPRLPQILRDADEGFSSDAEVAGFEQYYDHRPKELSSVAAIESLSSVEALNTSSQYGHESAPESDARTRRRPLAHDRYKDDPFYIGSEEAASGSSTPFHEVLRRSNGNDVDIESIPIMSLDLSAHDAPKDTSKLNKKKTKRRRPPAEVHITQDVTLDTNSGDYEQASLPDGTTGTDKPALTSVSGAKKSILQVDSSNFGSLSLGGEMDTKNPSDRVDGAAEDAEMAKALAEVERLRLEMQRASERVEAANGVPNEGTLVKKKRRPTKKQDPIATPETQPHPDDGNVVRKKKRKKRKPEDKETLTCST